MVVVINPSHLTLGGLFDARFGPQRKAMRVASLVHSGVHVAIGSDGPLNPFLNMMFATPCEEYEVDPVVAHALDQLLILHADHEQNCSTSTVRSPMPLLRDRIPPGTSPPSGAAHRPAPAATRLLPPPLRRSCLHDASPSCPHR
jgi:hypothetical protein